MTTQQRQARKDRLTWVLENVDLIRFDPYNIYHVRDVANKMIMAGMVRHYNNFTMVEQSVHTLLIEARKLKGLTWRDLK